MAKEQIISFWSAKGGTGKTVLSVAFAMALKKYKKNLVLADLKEIIPHIHKHFNMDLTDKSDIYEAIENERNVSETLEKHLKEKSGIRILSGVGINDFAKFEEKHFSSIINALKRDFNPVVIDTGGGICFSSVYAALKNSDMIFTVTAQDRLSIEDTAELMNFVCNRWNIERSRFKVFLNMIKKEEADIQVAERVLGSEVFVVRHGQKNIARDMDKTVMSLFRKNKTAGFIGNVKEVGSVGAN